MRSIVLSSISAFIMTPIVLIGMQFSNAQVMQSPSFRMQSDSINFGGGLSSSTNFVQESTFGEVATGPATSTTYNLFAGFQQMQEVSISISAAPDVVMGPDITGIVGGESNGSTTVTVITDSPSGYELTIRASGTPAMRKGADTISDYSPVGAVPDLLFTTGSSDEHFGYSPFGVDTVQRFQTNGAVCDVSGSASSTACWDGLSTSDVQIAAATSPNQPNGATTTVFFKVGLGNAVSTVPGVYTATTTLTALPL